jgi:hypothetical protein
MWRLFATLAPKPRQKIMNMKPFISISLFVFSCLCSNLALAADTAMPSPRPFAIVALDNPQSIAVDRAGNLSDVHHDKIAILPNTDCDLFTHAISAGGTINRFVLFA